MTETKTDPKTEKLSDEDLEAAASPASQSLLAEGDRSYIDPDLSFRDGVPELVGEEKEWAEARDNARKEGLQAAVASEKKVTSDRAKEREEADEKSRQALKEANAEATKTSTTKTASGSSGATR